MEGSEFLPGLDDLFKTSAPLSLNLDNLVDLDDVHESGASTSSTTEDLFAVTPEMLRARVAQEKSAKLTTTSLSGGASLEDEQAQSFKHMGCTIISRAAWLLRVPQVVVASARIYFHRFYLVHAWNRFDAVNVARCCLFLACKAEEHLRKVRDVINCVQEVVSPKDTLDIGQRYWKLRDEVTATEALVLRTLDFDLSTRHPYMALLNFLYSLGVCRKAFYQCSLAVLNDSYYTTLCLTARPELLAVASIYVAGELSGEMVDLNPDTTWWEIFDVTWEELLGVSEQIVGVLDKCSSRKFEDSFLEYQRFVDSQNIPCVKGRYRGT